MEIIRLIRDVAVIILALETIVFFFALLFLTWQAWKLVKLAKAQVGVVTNTATQVISNTLASSFRIHASSRSRALSCVSIWSPESIAWNSPCSSRPSTTKVQSF